MTFKELVNKVRNLVLEAKNVTIEDTESKFTSENVEGALKECIDRADEAFQEADSGKHFYQLLSALLLHQNKHFKIMRTILQDLRAI